MEEIIVKVDGKEYKVKVEECDDGKVRVHCDGDVYELETRKESAEEDATKETEKKKIKEGGANIIEAPLPAIVFSVDVKVGDKVKKGEKLLSLMAMKMENEVTAPVDGTVKEIKVKKNDNVEKGDVLVALGQ